MGIMLKHLTPATKTGSRSYRRRFPRNLRSIIGRWEHQVVLGSERSPGFLSRYEDAAAEFNLAVSQANRKLNGAFDALTPPQIAYLAKVFERQCHELSEHAVREGRVDQDANGWWWMEDEFREWRVEGDLEEIERHWGRTARALIDMAGLLVDPEDRASFQELCWAINDVAIAYYQSGAPHARSQGYHVPMPAEPERPEAPRAPEKPTKAGVPLLATFDAYAASQGLTVGVRDEWREAIRQLTVFLGHDDAARLTSENLRDWRDKLLQEVTSRGTPRSPKTVRGKYLAAIRALLGWAVEEGLLPGNVATGVTVRVPKQPKLRDRAFTSEEAKAILEGCLRAPPPGLSAGYARALRWVPWLCAYTGARVNEFSQMRGVDVQEVEGIWTVRITPEAGTVKAKEARVVPLHPHLIDQGFVDMVKSVGPGPLFYEPGKRRVGTEGNRHFKKVGEKLAAWVRQGVGITDPAIQPNHAWRHTFKSLSYSAGIEERIADAIQGHAPRSVGRTYFHPSLQDLSTAIERLPRFKVPGV